MLSRTRELDCLSVGAKYKKTCLQALAVGLMGPSTNLDISLSRLLNSERLFLHSFWTIDAIIFEEVLASKYNKSRTQYLWLEMKKNKGLGSFLNAAQRSSEPHFL